MGRPGMPLYPPDRPTLPWLRDRTILYAVHGSRAFGTHRPDSDYDYKGVAVAPLAFRDGFLNVFEQAEFNPKADGVDAVVYDLRKFFKLACDCNPSFIEVLWSDEDAIVLCTEAGRRLVEHRADFLSQKALHTFRGYAMQQLKRIETHRRWLLNPITEQPTRAAFGLPDPPDIPKDQLMAAQAAITAKMDSWSIDFGDMEEATKLYIWEQIDNYLVEVTIGADEKFLAAGRLLGFAENFLDRLDRERRYKNTLSDWHNYNTWKEHRNPARAALEAQHGFDTKHGMHLVRLMRMCREIPTEGVVRVRRPDADELNAIRDGAWTYDQLMTWAREQDESLLRVKSVLPKQPDRVMLNNLCIEITGMLPND